MGGCFFLNFGLQLCSQVGASGLGLEISRWSAPSKGPFGIFCDLGFQLALILF